MKSNENKTIPMETITDGRGGLQSDQTRLEQISAEKRLRVEKFYNLNPTLCEICRRAEVEYDEYHNEVASGWSYHWTLDDSVLILPKLESLLTSGCELCRFWSFMFLENYIDEGLVHNLTCTVESLVEREKKIVAYISFPEFAKTDIPKLKKFYYSPEIEAIFNVELDGEMLPAKNGEPAISVPLDRSPRLPTTDPLSSTNINFIRDWASQCILKHDACQRNEQGYRPTRLIYVGGPVGTGAKLVLGHELQESPNYVALTYCWGDVSKLQEDFRTVKNNLQDRLISLGERNLPQTLKDAILTTRSLAIDYLWIDCLCILQDCPADWEIEAFRMTDVYQNAFITITPIFSGGMEEGFVRDREFHTCNLTFDNASSNHTHRWTYPEFLDTLYMIRDAPWNARGWTYQEGRLSRRVLFFCPNILYLICANEVRSELDIENDAA